MITFMRADLKSYLLMLIWNSCTGTIWCRRNWRRMHFGGTISTESLLSPNQLIWSLRWTVAMVTQTATRNTRHQLWHNAKVKTCFHLFLAVIGLIRQLIHRAINKQSKEVKIGTDASILGVAAISVSNACKHRSYPLVPYVLECIKNWFFIRAHH